jgi:hypothetical protein
MLFNSFLKDVIKFVINSVDKNIALVLNGVNICIVFTNIPSCNIYPAVVFTERDRIVAFRDVQVSAKFETISPSVSISDDGKLVTSLEDENAYAVSNVVRLILIVFFLKKTLPLNLKYLFIICSLSGNFIDRYCELVICDPQRR